MVAMLNVLLYFILLLNYWNLARVSNWLATLLKNHLRPSDIFFWFKICDFEEKLGVF